MNEDHKKLYNIAATYDGMLGSRAGCDLIMVIRHDDCGSTDQERLEHVRWMCHQVHEFVDVGLIDKANRWIGFIQGVLLRVGLFTLEELKDHNR